MIAFHITHLVNRVIRQQNVQISEDIFHMALSPLLFKYSSGPCNFYRWYSKETTKVSTSSKGSLVNALVSGEDLGFTMDPIFSDYIISPRVYVELFWSVMSFCFIHVVIWRVNTTNFNEQIIQFSVLLFLWIFN